MAKTGIHKETWEARYHTPSWYWGPSRRKRHKEIKALIASRVGSITHCVCDELHEFDLDYPPAPDDGGRKPKKSHVI